MQTFLPIASFNDSATSLDYRRLGKQRVEAYQILNTLRKPNRWRNHPAVKMWKGYEVALIAYGCLVCLTWKGLGYKDTCLQKINDHLDYYDGDVVYPPWFGDERFHRSHKSNLIRKFPEFYKPKWPDVPDDLPYYWPV